MFVLILAILAVTISWYFLARNYEYWQKRGINGPKPIPFIGNMGKSFVLKSSPAEIFAQIYNEFKTEDVVGLYRATTPLLLIRSPEVIKEVTTKSFGHFHDNDLHIDKNIDPLFGRNPFVLKGEEWKVARQQLTPAFTGGKMKWMYPLLEHNCQEFVKFIREEKYNANELSSRFTLNNVASCAFGLEGKCYDDDKSEFRQLAEEFFSPGSWNVLASFLTTICPPLLKIYSVKFVPQKVEDQLCKLVDDVLKYRKDNNIVRNDFLHLMSQLKSSCKDYDFTNIDVTAHAAGFFADGFLSSSTVMSFTLFEIAANAEVQAKLREEVIAGFGDQNSLSYETVQSMEYLEGVINEALRKHPPIASLQKVCTKTFTTTTSRGQTITIDEGTSVVLPLFGLHHDEEYFENPDKFRPERFVGDNKDKLTKHTFLAFGEGPRVCLGQRFGMLQIKMGIAYVVKHYQIAVNTKTKVPIKYDPTNFLTSAVGGLWLDFRKIL